MTKYDNILDAMLDAPICPFGNLCTERCVMWNDEADNCNINLTLGAITMTCEQLVNPKSIYNQMKK